MKFAYPYSTTTTNNKEVSRLNWLSASLVIIFLALSAQPSFGQSSDGAFRVNQLEEQIRQLNGKIEEMNFQLLQVQEQMRRMQEDNEFRFQELEEKRQGSLKKPTDNEVARTQAGDSLGKQQPSDLNDANNQSDGETKVAKTQKPRLPRTIDGVEIFDPTATNTLSENLGREVPLGTITFDENGNILDSALGKPLDLTGGLVGSLSTADSGDSQKDEQYSSIQSARELFDLGFDYFQMGDYQNSEQVFEVFNERFPDDNKTPNAQFWLGESKFSQSNFKGAAKVFLDAHNNWPDARIAPQTLLKLGVSLAGMQQRELACATYVKVYKKYPQMSGRMRARVAAEQKSSHCLNG